MQPSLVLRFRPGAYHASTVRERSRWFSAPISARVGAHTCAPVPRPSSIVWLSIILFCFAPVSHDSTRRCGRPLSVSLRLTAPPRGELIRETGKRILRLPLRLRSGSAQNDTGTGAQCAPLRVQLSIVHCQLSTSTTDPPAPDTYTRYPRYSPFWPAGYRRGAYRNRPQCARRPPAES